MKDNYILQKSPHFPSSLLSVDPPLAGLYVKGVLPVTPSISIVGTREPTPYGILAVKKLVPLLVSHGFVIVSGLARGIDTYAHRVTLEHGGKTVAVLAGGITYIYPPENAHLATSITQTGAIISENPPEYRVTPADFLKRNRIVAAISVATIVIEGRARSGTFSTANFAVSLGRDVYAVPGRIDAPLSVAPNKLISLGARIVTDPVEVASELADTYL
jgi:DNA processing protein